MSQRTLYLKVRPGSATAATNAEPSAETRSGSLDSIQIGHILVQVHGLERGGSAGESKSGLPARERGDVRAATTRTRHRSSRSSGPCRPVPMTEVHDGRVLL